MEIEDMRLIKDTILVFIKDTEKNYLFIGKMGKIIINNDEQQESCFDCRKNKILTFTSQMDCSIQISLVSNNGAVFHFFPLRDKDEYKKIISILEVLL